MQGKRRGMMMNIMTVILIGLTALAFVKAIWISLDIDESYAIASAYRMVRGDRLIRDMWEPHQLSAFLSALFAAPYIRIRGNTEYLVIYLRMVGILIHTGMGVFLYRELRKGTDRRFAFCMLLLHLNYLPKWVQMPEFELMHYWCLLGIFLVLHAYFTGKEPRAALLFVGGCLLTGSLFCYPTMILLYPFYLLAICLLERQRSAKRSRIWKSCGLFTLGAFLPGSAFLGYLFSYMSFEEIRRYVSYIFLDTSHNVYTMGEKWAMYAGQIWEQAKQCGFYYLLAALIAVGAYSVCRFLLRKKDPMGQKDPFDAADGWKIVTTILLLAAALMQCRGLYGFLLEDENQFFFQIRYMAVLIPAVILCIRLRKKDNMRLWLYLCILPCLVSLVAVLLMTNMDTNTAYAKVYLGVLGSLLVFHQYVRENIRDIRWKRICKALCIGLGGLILAGLLVCRLVLIRVSGCLPVTILAPLTRMEIGPEKGVYILQENAGRWNDNYRELESLVKEEDRVLYIGAESLVYVELETVPATPSTQGTTVYNEMFLRYYEEHPERLPDVIVYDKSFGEDPVYALYYSYSLQYPQFLQWLEQNYRDGQITETDHMIVVRKE